MTDVVELHESLRGYVRPFRVGERPHEGHSMYPIRDAADHVLMYVYRRQVADLIVTLLNSIQEFEQWSA